ncbi:hypothetical protein UlMin_028828 [Ulmus minor]
MKYIERGHKIDENVAREIINHRSLRHPNIIRFRRLVVLTPTHLAIVMEYAVGGELFEIICNAGRFSEDEARYFFQQLIFGVDYCYNIQICHKDLKLENTLLDGSPAPRLKICYFGYSKSSLLHLRPKSTVFTPAYIAPEVLSQQQYDGKNCALTNILVSVASQPRIWVDGKPQTSSPNNHPLCAHPHHSLPRFFLHPFLLASTSIFPNSTFIFSGLNSVKSFKTISSHIQTNNPTKSQLKLKTPKFYIFKKISI